MNYTRPSASELRTRYESSRLVEGSRKSSRVLNRLPEFYSTPN
jgi:hypothetical protein